MAHPIVSDAKKPLEYHQLEKLLTDENQALICFERNREFYNGNHWQGGEGYIGPRPLDSSSSFEHLMLLLERGFVSKNIIKEIVGRQVAAILGNQPDWTLTPRRPIPDEIKRVPDPNFVPDPTKVGEKAPLIPDPKGETVPGQPSKEEQQKIDEGNAALNIIWDLRKPLKIIKEAFRSRLFGGRGVVRTYVPARFLEGGTVATAKDFQEAAERVFVNHPAIENATVAIDVETQESIGVTKYERAKQKIIEFSFVDEEGETYIGVIPEAQNVSGIQADVSRALDEAATDAGVPEDTIFANAELSSGLDLNKRLTIYELKGDLLVSDQVVQNNQLVNLALTMCGTVLVEAGFAELAVTNVEFEMERVPDSGSPTGYVDKPKRIKRGPGVVQNFVGMEQVNEQTGQSTLTTPGVHYKEPSPITTFEEGKQLGYRNALEEVHQIHALIAGDATPSGESRITALADFVMFSLDFKEEIDALGVWFLEICLSWIALIAGKPGYFNDLRATFDSKIYVGKLTAEERTALINEVTAKLRSRSNAMLLLGIDDPDAEILKIAEEDSTLNPATALSIQRQKIGLAADQAALAPPTPPSPTKKPAPGDSGFGGGTGGGASGGSAGGV